MFLRQLFLQHVAQTSAEPMALQVAKAEGSWLWDAEGKKYLDLIGGIAVANTGHRHPAVLAAIREQLDAYLHVMVYGEVVQSPQVRYAHRLTQHLPPSLNSVYFTNSGAEAVEGAMKLAKRVTGRTQILAFKDSYHGSTQGALSIIGSEYWRQAFRPLLPGIGHAMYNDDRALESITAETACVILETVQAEAGIRPPRREWLQALAARCRETGTLFILDEIQAGFGRTGKLWAFEHFDLVPDVLLLGKALGGGLPLGAFIAGKPLMDAFTDRPVLGHITTFGGHPLSCAAGLAAFELLLQENWIGEASDKAAFLRAAIGNAGIGGLKEISSFGLWMALHFDSFAQVKALIGHCLSNGIFTDWFLFAPHALRISPPLSISREELALAAEVLKGRF